MTEETPAHQWQQQFHCYVGDDASSTTMLAWLQQRCHCNKGNNHHCDDSEDACASTATMPLQQGQQCHCDDGKDACTLMMTKTPLQQGQQRQLEDSNNTIVKRETTPLRIKSNNAIIKRATMPAWQQQGRLRINNATMPSSWGQQLQLQWRQRCLRIDGNSAIMMRATTPAWQQVTRTMMLAQQQQRRLCINDSDDAIITKATTTIATTAKMLGHWQQRAITTRATMPALRQVTRSTMLAQQWQRRLRINDGNDTIMTMAKMPVSINVLTMAPILQPYSQDACGLCSCAFATLGWAEGWFGVDWMEINWSPLNQYQFHLDSFLRFYPPKLPLSLISTSPNCPH
jgi:hypothetical protein